jgi:Tfp pilus assembly protein PilF
MSRHLAIVVAPVLILVAACASSGAGSDATGYPSRSKDDQQGSVDPLTSLTYMRQGSVLMQQGRFEQALEAFEQADRIAPGNATNKNMIGLCHLNLGSFDSALMSFDEALQLTPGFTDARNNRGATYLAMGQLHLAEVDFQAVLADSTYPHRKQVYYNLGMTYLQRGQIGAAEENFRNAIVLPNPVFDAYIQLATLAQQQGELERSKSLLEEARLQFPDRTLVSFELGKLLLIMGEEDEGRHYLEKVIDDAPKSAEADTARSLLGKN